MLTVPANNIDDVPNVLTKYPWEEWTDGQLHIIDLDAYGVSKAALRVRMHQKAEALGKKVKTRTTEDGRLAFQFLDKSTTN